VLSFSTRKEWPLTVRGTWFIVSDDKIRRVDANTKVITTYAGALGGPRDEGIPAVQAGLGQPNSLAVDSQDNLYVGEIDSNYERVRRINAQTGIITTVAGGGGFRYISDGVPAVGAGLSIGQIALDGADNLFIADPSNARIRKVDAQTGIITTVAGNGTDTYNGDGGLATQASLTMPSAIAVNSVGDLFIAGNSRIRKVSAIDGKISTFAGTGHEGNSGDGGPPTVAEISPGSLAIDGDTLYLLSFDRIRAISPAGACHFYLNLTSASFSSGTGAGSFNISTSNGCSWTSSSSVPWVNRLRRYQRQHIRHSHFFRGGEPKSEPTSGNNNGCRPKVYGGPGRFRCHDVLEPFFR